MFEPTDEQIRVMRSRLGVNRVTATAWLRRGLPDWAEALDLPGCRATA